jgi:regulatory protein
MIFGVKERNLKKEKNHESIDFKEHLRNARIYALRLLSYSAKTYKEIADRLNTRGFSHDIVTQTLSELQESGYINDQKVAEDLALSCLIKKGRGREAIQYTLYQRGIEKELIRTIVESISVDKEAQAAWSYVTKRLKISDVQSEKNKVYHVLKQRGFSSNAIEQVLKENHNIDS